MKSGDGFIKKIYSKIKRVKPKHSLCYELKCKKRNGTFDLWFTIYDKCNSNVSVSIFHFDNEQLIKEKIDLIKNLLLSEDFALFCIHNTPSMKIKKIYTML